MGEPPRKEPRLQRDIGGEEQASAINKSIETLNEKVPSAPIICIRAEEMVEKNVKDVEPDVQKYNDVEDPVLHEVYKSSVFNVLFHVHGSHTDTDTMMEVDEQSDRKRPASDIASWSSSVSSGASSPDNVRQSQQTRGTGRG